MDRVKVEVSAPVPDDNSEEGDDDSSDVKALSLPLCRHCVGLIVAPPDDVPWFCQKCAGKKQNEKSGKRPGSKLEGSVRKRKKLP
ncbi:hypothetical protein ANCDUO_06910 [Ancylostoma duodenale]|uniref:Uncharacterized protein n=1 Tax=Ancylostoma duodenale TaxID=51022 RepID=A0A0C2H0C9_9BILA|nr:hypothetical protein ANCDUO_06910 [Ancylostoma duodenale]